MENIIEWSGHEGIAFFVSPTEVRAFSGLAISTAADTEDKEGNEKLVTKKATGGYEISLTAVLNAALGVDVKGIALAIAQSARDGETGYFYCGGDKLFPCLFMSVSAKIKDIELLGGTWKECTVDWTLKQSGKFELPKEEKEPVRVFDYDPAVAPVIDTPATVKSAQNTKNTLKKQAQKVSVSPTPNVLSLTQQALSLVNNTSNKKSLLVSKKLQLPLGTAVQTQGVIPILTKTKIVMDTK